MRPARPRRSLLARCSGALTAIAVALGGLGLVAVLEQPAQAVTAQQMLQSFDPSDIISDAVMFNATTMSTAAVQAFLNGRVPSCRSGSTCLKDYHQDTTDKAADPMCGAYRGAKDESAATIITRVGKACGVNPQVLLVTLQKEQGLVLDDSPGPRQYRSATGYGCPDTAPCDSDYYGFFNQVYKAAWAFRRYTSPKGTEGAGWTRYNWFPVGRPSGVLFHPNAACGAGAITIKNAATAVLYYFTPYQPNSASLAAGFGIGNSCSSYGNRNFFLYFTSWFGSTHYVVTGDIATYWRAKGGAKGSLGDPLANAIPITASGGGSTQRFRGGTVYSSKAGTFLVAGAIASEYTSTLGPLGPLGWPRTDVVSRSQHGGGTVQSFTGGTVYSSKAGAFTVRGAVYSRYGDAGFQGGSLGWPTSDAVASASSGGGTWQAFAGGRIAVTAKASTVVTGGMLTKWLARGAEAGTLGWPTAEASTVKAAGRSGTVQRFDSGVVVQLGSKLYTVTGDLGRNYLSHGASTGSLGWPTGPAQASAQNGGGWSQRFQGGAILYSAASKAHMLTGRELALYDQRGGVDGTLGWPGGRVKLTAHGVAGAQTPFTNGRIWTSKLGTVAVLGAIGRAYDAKDGAKSALGWPLSSAKREHGLLTQRFQKGRITYTSAGGAKVRIP